MMQPKKSTSSPLKHPTTSPPHKTGDENASTNRSPTHHHKPPNPASSFISWSSP
ncbi:hypothetical protein BKA56DRAFT_578175 [Ilyonectria sp. MPI-CAGE-AT-0026]|nr:hypothetical protein BKA56DRAFT_578175 [Ilyonectria sp. MPI-CAGE-AT-0026]